MWCYNPIEHHEASLTNQFYWHSQSLQGFALSLCLTFELSHKTVDGKEWLICERLHISLAMPSKTYFKSGNLHS